MGATAPVRQTSICLYLPFLRQFHNFPHLSHDPIVVFCAVGFCAAGAVFDAVFCISKAAATLIPQGIQGAEAEQAVEVLFFPTLMTGELLAFSVLEELMVHDAPRSFTDSH